MIDNDYQLAWALYAVAALGCLLVWFRLTGWMWRYLREPLRLLMAVLLLTPTIVDPSKELFAPAVAITAMDVLLKVGDNAWRAVADLAMYGLIALALYLLFVAIRWPLERWWKRRARTEPATDEAAPTLRELMQAGAGERGEDRPAAGVQHGRRVEPRL